MLIQEDEVCESALENDLVLGYNTFNSFSAESFKTCNAWNNTKKKELWKPRKNQTKNVFLKTKPEYFTNREGTQGCEEDILPKMKESHG